MPDANDLVMPSKLLPMLASGIPIIAIAEEESECAKVLQNCGTILKYEDSGMLSITINDIITNEVKYRDISRNGHFLAKDNYSIDLVLSTALESLNPKTASG